MLYLIILPTLAAPALLAMIALIDLTRSHLPKSQRASHA